MKKVTIYGTGESKNLLISALAALALGGKICDSAIAYDQAGNDEPMVVYKHTVPYGAILYKTHGLGLCAFINRVDGEVEIAADEGVTHDEVEHFFEMITALAAPMEREVVLSWILEALPATMVKH
jgi:hypothetical protein